MTSSRLVVVGGCALLLASCGGENGDDFDETSALLASAVRTETLDGNLTLKFVPPGTHGAAAATVSTATSRTVSLFYPKAGQSQDGLCWQGLTSDSAGNLYPSGSGDFSKLDRNANVINGENDTNFFVTGGNSNWGTLDEARRKFFTASGKNVRSAAFRAGARFSNLVGGLKSNGEAVAVGRGPLAGSLLVTDSLASLVFRVTLKPLAVELFASGSLLKTPEAIASAPNGTLYVINVGSTTDPAGRTLLKITPAGKVSIFARASASDTAARRMVAVDNEGTVFWSSARGIDRFKPDGRRLSPLPGPPDQEAFENPMGAAFDAQDSLYVVENFGCKKIYKYTEH